MTTFVLVSDVHCAEVLTPPGDVLIAAGDMTMDGTLEEFQWLEEWFRKQPQKRKFYIPGNHDFGAFKDRKVLREHVLKTPIWLIDEECHTLGNIRMYGSPWTYCPFTGKGWGYPLFMFVQCEEKWSEIPEGLDILVTHGPPYGVSDRHWKTGALLGDYKLRQQLQSLESPPKVHIFGHIHSGQKITQQDGILYLNAAVCDEQYMPTNPIIILEYEPGKQPTVKLNSDHLQGLQMDQTRPEVPQEK